MPAWEVAGFYDDACLPQSTCEGLPCLGGVETLLAIEDATQVILALGDPVLKQKIANRLLLNKKIIFPSLIHPKATLLNESTIRLGAGCIITAGVVLTTSISIGEHTLLNLNVTVGHDTHIGKYCSVMPGANLAGQVSLGEAVLIGSGASVLNKLTIASFAKVGAGAVVTRDVGEGLTVVGVPAKVRS
jgi:sugar O-acyltransferase (sialic acid O-acetyltransferase NeuD family)